MRGKARKLSHLEPQGQPVSSTQHGTQKARPHFNREEGEARLTDAENLWPLHVHCAMYTPRLTQTQQKKTPLKQSQLLLYTLI